MKNVYSVSYVTLFIIGAINCIFQNVDAAEPACYNINAVGINKDIQLGNGLCWNGQSIGKMKGSNFVAVSALKDLTKDTSFQNNILTVTQTDGNKLLAFPVAIKEGKQDLNQLTIYNPNTQSVTMTEVDITDTNLPKQQIYCKNVSDQFFCTQENMNVCTRLMDVYGKEKYPAGYLQQITKPDFTDFLKNKNEQMERATACLVNSRLYSDKHPNDKERCGGDIEAFRKNMQLMSIGEETFVGSPSNSLLNKKLSVINSKTGYNGLEVVIDTRHKEIDPKYSSGLSSSLKGTVHTVKNFVGTIGADTKVLQEQQNKKSEELRVLNNEKFLALKRLHNSCVENFSAWQKVRRMGQPNTSRGGYGQSPTTENSQPAAK